MTDLVNHPPHYNKHLSGIEIIEVAETLDRKIRSVYYSTGDEHDVYYGEILGVYRKG